MFARDRYVERMLIENGARSERNVFEEEVSRLRLLLPADVRSCINGHDLIQLVHWYAGRGDTSVRRVDERVFGGILLSSLEHATLAGQPSFVELKRRLAGETRGRRPA